MADKEAALLDLIHRQERQLRATLDAATNALSAPLASFQGWYDRSAITGLVELLAALLAGFEKVAARDADAYMAEAVSLVTGKRLPPAGIRNTELGRIDVSNTDVLARAANSYRWQQAKNDKAFLQMVRSGKLLDPPPPTPLEAAQDRIGRAVATNLQMAQRSQMTQTMKTSDRVTFYRRIVHPELADEGSCGLCFAAADRKYHKADLMPIHPECHCTELPGTSTFDPHSINEADFSQLYTDAGGTSADELRKTRYKVDDHGEIGPVLRPDDQPIRTKRQAERAERKTADSGALQRKRQELAAALVEARKHEAEDPSWGSLIDQQEERLAKLDAEIGGAR